MPPAIRRIARGAPKDRKTSTPGRTQSHKFRAQDFVRKRQNEALSDHYTTGKLLGEGQFGEVFIGTVKQSSGGKGDTRAIKRIQKELLTEEDHEEVFNEFTTLKQMDHPNICKMYEFFEDTENFWFVQELCSGGELLDELERIETFPEAGAALIMKQVLSCVHYCHSQKQVVHRDLKLENILLEDGTQQKSGTATGESYTIKIIDFGLSTTFAEGQVLSSPVGSMHYIAPEVLEQEYSYKCDIWSCGVIAYILLCGFAPFEGASDRDMRELIMMGNVSFEDPIWKNNVSQEAKDFVSLLLTYEADKRPEAGEALKHPWIQNAHKAHAQQFKANKSGTDAAIKALQNCRSFESASKLKQATCAFMTSQLVLSGGDEEESGSATAATNTHASAILMGEIFRAMDLDSDGRLSKDELRLGFLDFLEESEGLTVEEVDDIFRRLDLSCTGYIDYSEFIVAAIGLHDQEQAHHQELLKQAFQRLLDRDASGYISHEKLRKEMAPFYGEDVEEAIIQKIIDQADDDKDGQISWHDFQTMMSKQADFTVPAGAVPLEVWAKQGREGSKNASKKMQTAAISEASKVVESEKAVPAKSLELSSKTPPTPGRKTRSGGAKSRLISAIFEKNLEKNREMGFDKFQYTSKKEIAPKRKLPRTRRVNFEELTKKATTKVNFNAKAIMDGRNKEIEQLAATPGRTRDRRATIVNMFNQEKADSINRREQRLKELASIKGTRRQNVRNSLQNTASHNDEAEKRGKQMEELKKIRASFTDGSGARKKLIDSWGKVEKKPSLAKAKPSQVLVMKDLKDFKEALGEEDGLARRFAKTRPSLPLENALERTGSRRWTRRLSGKSLLKDSLHDSSHHSRRGLERSSSEQDIQEENVEGRLVEMQVEAKSPKSARRIEPIRRLNSFDSDQEQDERDQRLDSIAPNVESSETLEQTDTASTKPISQKRFTKPPSRRGNLSSDSGHKDAIPRNSTSSRSRGDLGSNSGHKDAIPWNSTSSRNGNLGRNSGHKNAIPRNSTSSRSRGDIGRNSGHDSLVKRPSRNRSQSPDDIPKDSFSARSIGDLSDTTVSDMSEDAESSPVPSKSVLPKRASTYDNATKILSAPRSHIEKAGPKNPNKLFIAPKNTPRFGGQPASSSTVKPRKRISTKPKALSMPPGTGAHKQLQKLAQKQGLNSQAPIDEAEIETSGSNTEAQ